MMNSRAVSASLLLFAAWLCHAALPYAARAQGQGEGPELSHESLHDSLRTLCADREYLQCVRVESSACAAAMNKAIDRGSRIAEEQLAQMPAAERAIKGISAVTHVGATLGGLVGTLGGRATICLPPHGELLRPAR